METVLNFSEDQGEIIMYETNESLKIPVYVENETVWLSQAQMAQLFGTSRNNITMHIRNIYKEGELEQKGTSKDFLHTTKHGAIWGKTQTAKTKLYNLDVIISVWYRVKSPIGTKFRKRALEIIKQYMLKGYAIHQRFEHLEYRIAKTEEKIDFFVKTSLPKNEGVFYNGEVFDAYTFVSKLIKLAKKRLILIDNYIDETVLTILSQRNRGVRATIYTGKISQPLSLAIQKHNIQYPAIDVKMYKKNHDRFLIVDDEIYHIWASIKDLGYKLFAFSKMTIDIKELLDKLEEL